MKIEDFEQWLDNEIHNDRIALSIKEQSVIIRKLKELNKVDE